MLRCRKDLCQFAEVLGCGGEEECVVRSAWAPHSQPSQPEIAHEVREEHLDLLSEFHRDFVLGRFGDRAGVFNEICLS